MKILLPLLAAITLVAVGFVLVELHTPITPAATPPPTPAPVAAPLPRFPGIVPPRVAAPPSTSTDPLDVVVNGKTRREWHAIYTDRELQIYNEIHVHQTLVDRAIAGEEPDPIELSNAHTRIAELKAQLKADRQELLQIDGPP
jgi:hypothetical protein